MLPIESDDLGNTRGLLRITTNQSGSTLNLRGPATTEVTPTATWAKAEVP